VSEHDSSLAAHHLPKLTPRSATWRRSCDACWSRSSANCVCVSFNCCRVPASSLPRDSATDREDASCCAMSASCVWENASDRFSSCCLSLASTTSFAYQPRRSVREKTAATREEEMKRREDRLAGKEELVAVSNLTSVARGNSAHRDTETQSSLPHPDLDYSHGSSASEAHKGGRSGSQSIGCPGQSTTRRTPSLGPARASSTPRGTKLSLDSRGNSSNSNVGCPGQLKPRAVAFAPRG